MWPFYTEGEAETWMSLAYAFNSALNLSSEGYIKSLPSSSFVQLSDDT